MSEDKQEKRSPGESSGIDNGVASVDVTNSRVNGDAILSGKEEARYASNEEAWRVYEKLKPRIQNVCRMLAEADKSA